MENIKKLKFSNTFTITTGHQLCLFTGPIFFIIKILQAIKICKDLENKFSDYNFVPIFWMATEGEGEVEGEGKGRATLV